MRPARIAEVGWDVAAIAVAVRWGAICLVVAGELIARAHAGESLPGALPLVVVLVLYGIWRTVRPIEPSAGGVKVAGAMALEALLLFALSAASGGWNSPYILGVGTSLLLGGLLGGVEAAGASLLAVVIAAALAGPAGAPGFAILDGMGRIGELTVMGAVGVYAGSVLWSRASKHEEEVARLHSADEINALLLELHARAADQPGFLSLRSAILGTVDHLKSVLAPDLVVLLLRDPTDEGAEQPWQVAVAEGVRLPAVLRDNRLPRVLKECSLHRGPHLRAGLELGEGLGPRSRSGLYVPMWARSNLLGLLAVERAASRPPFGTEHLGVLEDVARHAALAIDNAKWFRRLRHLGAEEERDRIARELHDRVGQSLAAVGLSLDNLADRAAGARGTSPAEPRTPTAKGPAQEVAIELRQLAAQVRAATAQVREKLSDLRSGPTANRGLVDLLDDLCVRVGARSGIAVSFDHDWPGRLPLLVEQEVWRIAQEAISNAERHAQASDLEVSLRRAGSSLLLEVCDNGRGLAASTPLRRDAFGLLGMRERAEVIGASLAIESNGGSGTVVRLRLPLEPR